VKDGIARGQQIEGEFTAEVINTTAGNVSFLFFENFEGGTSTENSWAGLDGT